MKTEINGVQIELTPEQIQKVLEAQKPVKTKEGRFKEIIQGINPEVDFDKYPTSIFWFKDGTYYFEYDWKNNYFWVNWKNVWSVFEDEYNMKYNDIQSFMKVQIEEHFKLKGVTPLSPVWLNNWLIEEHFKLKGVTPLSTIDLKCPPIEEHFKLKGVTPALFQTSLMLQIEEHFKLKGVTPDWYFYNFDT